MVATPTGEGGWNLLQPMEVSIYQNADAVGLQSGLVACIQVRTPADMDMLVYGALRLSSGGRLVQPCLAL